MKKGLIVIGIAAFLLGLIIYISINYSPYDNDKLVELAGAFGVSDPQSLTDNVGDLIEYGLVFSLLNTNAFYVLLFLGLAFSICFVAGLHMLIEKLFFKRFYEEPRVWPAIRRGVLLYLLVFGIVFFRLINGFTFQNAFLIVLLVVTLEFLAMKFTDK